MYCIYIMYLPRYNCVRSIVVPSLIYLYTRWREIRYIYPPSSIQVDKIVYDDRVAIVAIASIIRPNRVFGT